MQRLLSIFGLGIILSAWLWTTGVPYLRASEGLRPYETEGTVVAIMSDQGHILIEHEPIEGPGFYMGKMEMPFNVADRALVEGLQKGDRVRFRVSEEKKSRIIEIKKLPQ